MARAFTPQLRRGSDNGKLPGHHTGRLAALVIVQHGPAGVVATVTQAAKAVRLVFVVDWMPQPSQASAGGVPVVSMIEQQLHAVGARSIVLSTPPGCLAPEASDQLSCDDDKLRSAMQALRKSGAMLPDDLLVVLQSGDVPSLASIARAEVHTNAELVLNVAAFDSDNGRMDPAARPPRMADIVKVLSWESVRHAREAAGNRMAEWRRRAPNDLATAREVLRGASHDDEGRSIEFPGPAWEALLSVSGTRTVDGPQHWRMPRRSRGYAVAAAMLAGVDPQECFLRRSGWTLEACGLFARINASDGLPAGGGDTGVAGVITAADAQAATPTPQLADPALLASAECAASASMVLPPDQVAIAIITSSPGHERIPPNLISTWLPEAQRLGVRLVFVSDQPVPGTSIETISCDKCEAGKFGLKWKTMRAFEYMTTAFPEATWFARVMDDTFVSLPNLLFHLAGYDPTTPVYLGDQWWHVRDGNVQWQPVTQDKRPFDHPTHPVEQYPAGGCGWVLSRPAADLAVRLRHVYDTMALEQREHDDVFWGMFMHDIGIRQEPASCLVQMPVRAAAGDDERLPNCALNSSLPVPATEQAELYPTIFRPCIIHLMTLADSAAALHKAFTQRCGELAIELAEDGLTFGACTPRFVTLV